MLAVSAALSSGILTVTIDSTDAVKSAFIRSDGTNYIVSTTTGGTGLTVTGGPASLANTTGITVNGATFGAESLTFEGSNDFTLTGALTTTKLETVTFNRQVSFGSVDLGSDTSTTVNVNSQMIASAGSITIQTSFLNLAADLNSTTADINLKLGTGGLALANNLTAADDVRLDTTGAISQTAGIITAVNLGARSQGDVSLTRNNLISTNFAAAARDVTFNNASTGLLTLGTVSSITNFFGTNGLSDSGVTTITAAGALSVTSSSYSTTGLNLNSAGLLTLNALMGANSGTVRFVAVGGVNQAGGLISGANLSARNSGAGDIHLLGLNLNAAALIAASNTASGGAVNVDNFFGSGFSVDTVTAGPAGFAAVTGITTNNGDVNIKYGPLTINQAINAGTGTVRIGSEGGISQTATGIITAAGLGLRNWNGGTIDLTGAVNHVDVLAADGTLNGGSVIKYRDADALMIGTISSGVDGFGTATGIITTSNDVTIVSGPLSINQAVNIGTGTLRLSTSGGVSGNASAVITASALGVQNSTSGNIDLSTATTSNITTLAAANTAAGGSVKYRDTNALTIGSVTADGTLFSAATGVASGGGDVTLVAGGALTLNQAVAAGAGTVRLTAAGDVTQAAAGAVTGAALGMRTTIGNIDLTTATTNNTATLAAANSAASGTVKYRDADAVAIGSVTADGTLFTAADGVTTSNGLATLVAGGTLTVDQAIAVGTGTVRISAAGNVTQAGTGAITGSALGIRTSAGNVDLTTATTNNITTLAVSDTAAGATVKYRDADAVTVGFVTVDGSLFSLTTGIVTSNGDLTLLTGGTLLLNQVVTVGSGTARLSAAGNVTQAAAGAVTGSALGVRTTAGNIDLTTATTNNTATLAAVNTSTSGTVKYRDADGLAIDGVAADGSLFAAVNGITAANGGTTIVAGGALAINQAVGVGSGTARLTASGGIAQAAAGTITASTLGLANSTTGHIDLTTSSTNNITTLAAKNSAAGGAIKYRDADALTIGSVTADGSLFAAADGISTAGGDVTLVSGALTLSQGIAAGAGTVRLNAAGNITQSAGAGIVAAVLGVRNTGSGPFILLSGATNNDVGTLAIAHSLNGSTVKFRDANDLVIGDVTADGTLFDALSGIALTNMLTLVTGGGLSLQSAVNVGTTFNGSVVRISAGGNVTQSAAGVITTGYLGVRTTAGDINLSTAANSFFGLAANNSDVGKSVKVVDTSSVSAQTINADGTLFASTTGIATNNGNVTIVSGGNVLTNIISAGTGEVRVSAAGPVTLNSVTAYSLGVRTTSGDVSVSSGTSSNVTVLSVVNSSASESTVHYYDADGFTVGTVAADGTLFAAVSGISIDQGHVSLVSRDTLALDQGVSVGLGTIHLTAAGGITQAATGAVTATELGVFTNVGNVDFTAAATNNVGTLAVGNTAASGTIKYRDVDGFTVGSVAAHGIAFIGVDGVSTSNGDVTLVAGGAIAIDQAVNAGSATVRLTAAGGVSQTTPGVVAAASLGVRNASSGDINLTGSSGNHIGTFAAFNGAAGGALTYTPADVTTVGTVLADGTLFTQTVGLTRTNASPTAGTNLGLTLAEGETGVVSGTLLKTNDVDNTAAQLIYAVTALPSHGELRLNGTALGVNGTFTQADLEAGLIAYTHDSSENFSDEFQFTVTDGEFTLPTADFALTISPVNDAPTAGLNLGLTLAEGATATIDGTRLKTNDVDNTTAQLVYTVTNLPTHGTVNLNGVALGTNGTFTQADLDAGSVTYTHDSSENFGDGFQFTVTDGEYALTEATFALTIAPVNDAPTAGLNLGLTLAEGATATIDGGLLTTNDLDSSSAQLIYTLTNLPAHGTVNLNGVALGTNGTFTQADLDAGKVTYTHDSSENFGDGFQFTVTDGEYALTEATFSLTITPVNDAPTAGLNLGATLAEGATLVLSGAQLQTNDVDNTTAQLVYTVTNLPAHGTLSLNGAALGTNGTFTQADLDAGNVTYAHDSSENFTDGFQFTVTDGRYALSTATFALTITPVNDAPVVAPQNFILYNRAVAGTIVGAVQASDRDAGQQRSFAIVGGNGALAINAATGVLAVVNPKLLVGTALNFVVRVTDNGAPPLATDAAISVSLRTADAPPTFTVVDGASAPLGVVNNQVKLALDERTEVTATRNGLVIATLAAADVDEPGVVFPLTMTDRSGAFAFDAAAGKLSIRDASKLDYEKTRSFVLTFTATDHGLVGLPRPTTSTLTMTVQLTDRNDAPTVTPTATFKLRENNGANTVVGTVTAVDVDGLAAFRNLQYGIVSQRDAGGNDVGIFSIDAARGTLKIAAANALNYEAQPQYTVVVRARDAAGLFADQTVVVQVIDVNEAVVLTLLDAAQNPATGLTVPENTPKGTVVGYLRVDNPDVARAETIKIALGDSLGRGFAVGAFDPASRLAPITVFDATRLNYEAINRGQFTLNFSVSDSGFLSNDGSRPGPITVNKTYNSLISDVNEAPTAVTFRTVGLPGGSAPIPAGTLFGTALGVDPDKTPQAFTYSLTPGYVNNDLFTIDASTGQLRSNLALGRRGTFNIQIRVTDAAGLFFNQNFVVRT